MNSIFFPARAGNLVNPQWNETLSEQIVKSRIGNVTNNVVSHLQVWLCYVPLQKKMKKKYHQNIIVKACQIFFKIIMMKNLTIYFTRLLAPSVMKQPFLWKAVTISINFNSICHNLISSGSGFTFWNTISTECCSVPQQRKIVPPLGYFCAELHTYP